MMEPLTSTTAAATGLPPGATTEPVKTTSFFPGTFEAHPVTANSPTTAAVTSERRLPMAPPPGWRHRRRRRRQARSAAQRPTTRMSGSLTAWSTLRHVGLHITYGQRYPEQR